jgi:hypothetical protein
MITMKAGLVKMNIEKQSTISEVVGCRLWIERRKNNLPRKNSLSPNGLISFSGESTEKPAKTK